MFPSPRDFLAPRSLGRRAGVASWTLASLLAVVFAFQGGAKLLGAPFEVAAFERWGYPDWFRLVVGAMEAAAVLLVLLPRTRLLAGIWITGIMFGAIMTHLRSNETASLPLPITVMAFAWVLAWIHRPAWRPT